MNIPGVFRSSRAAAGDDAASPAAAGSPADDARKERICAQQRTAALLQSGPTAPCGNPEYDEDYDDDGCPTVDVSPSSLYVRETADADDVEPSDVHQSRMANCYLMATLCALAGCPEGRALIQNAIAENKDARGQTVSYTVTLYRSESHWFGPDTFRPVHVTVDPSFSARHATPNEEGGKKEIWPLVLEKAYAVFCGSYKAMNAPEHTAGEAMRALTGRPVTTSAVSGLFAYDADDLQRDLSAGKIVVLGTPRATREGIVPNHAYWASGIVTVGGKPCVALVNPWNNADPPVPVPVDELKRTFSNAHVGSVR